MQLTMTRVQMQLFGHTGLSIPSAKLGIIAGIEKHTFSERPRWKWVVSLVLLVFCQFVLGCGALDIQSRKAPGVNLSQYRTFNFAEARHLSDVRFFTLENEGRVKAAIRTELEERGLRLAKP